MAGTISSAGIGSGLDVSSIISQLVAIESTPLKKLQAQAQTIQTQLSAFGQLQSLTSTLKDSTTALLRAESYTLTKAATADAAAVAATSTATAVPGQYNVAVTKLAATQVVVSATGVGQLSAATDVVGGGTLSIQRAAAGATAVDVTILDTDTLAQVRDKINAANAGVTASIINDASGARLALQSTATGADNAFTISAIDNDGNNTDAAGLSRLATANMTLAQPASNAEGTINGIAVTSATNQFANVVDGVTFSFGKLSASPVAVTVSRDTDSLKSMINSFVTAFNGVANFLSTNTKYDESTKTAALFQGDSTVVGLQSALRGLVGQSTGASATFSTLSSLGIEYQRDGTLKVNDTKLNAALANPAELQTALSNLSAGTPANTGLVRRFSDFATTLLQANGTFSSRQESFRMRLSANSDDQARAQQRIEAVEARLRRQYSALDETMSRSGALSQYVSQQITNWNKSTG